MDERQPLVSGVDHPSYTMEEHPPRIRIERNVYSLKTEELKKKSKCFPSPNCSCHCKPKDCLKSVVPSINWLCSYKWKDWFFKDLIAGFTVAVMNIPQGMGYALLGNVPPIVGIYMAFFPVIVYAFLGTSRHISMGKKRGFRGLDLILILNISPVIGSFAVVCLMTGNVVTTYSHHSVPVNSTEVVPQYSPVEVATAVTFLVGVYQVVMYFLRFGALCSILSETLVSGFTAGAAVHVFTSQLKDVLGITLRKRQGPFKLIFMYGEIFSTIHTANIAAVVASAITSIVLIANNEFLKPWVQTKTFIPVPIELIVVLCGTLASTYGNFADIYRMKTVGDIPVGLPDAAMPPFDLLPSIAVSSAIIAVIAYVIALSMALIFANKYKYEVDPNQELLAQGTGNVVGSFFSCLPFSASLSRSVIQANVGGCTQLASLFSCSILLFVLLWIAPFFEPLPRCILASLIIVSLKGILFQAKDIVGIWKISSLDAIIWMATYVTVIIVDIDYGLLVGVCVSLVMLFIRGDQSQMFVLERVPGSEIYLAPNKHHTTEDVPRISIVQYVGSINFFNKANFRQKLKNVLGDGAFQDHSSLNKIAPTREMKKETLVLELSSLSYIDSSGAAMLKSLIQDVYRTYHTIHFVGLQVSCIQMFHSCKVFSSNPELVFPTVHDAVVYSKEGGKVFSIDL